MIQSATSFLIIFLLVSLLLISGCATQLQNQADEQAQEARQKKVSSLDAQMALDYLAKGNRVAAREKLLLALDADAKSVPANSAMGYYYEQTGQFELAEKFYLKAITYAEIKGAPENNYAIFLCQQKRYQEAQHYFKLAMNDAQYVNVANAYANAGFCERLIPNDEQAIIYFKQALQNDPNLKGPMIELAKIYNAQGQYQEAYNMLQTELMIDKHPSQETLELERSLAHQLKDTK